MSASDDRANAAIQVAVHGPGPVFGALAIGECFWWPGDARGLEPMVKTARHRYAWSRGTGTAQAYDRVERTTEGEASR